MSQVATLIADMVRAGVDPDIIGRTADALSKRDAIVVPDEAAERRRAKDRYRKRLRNSAEVGGKEEALSPFEVSPAPLPKTLNPIPPSPPKGGSSPAVFEAMWELYPNKVGKRAAQSALVNALKRAPADTIMTGLRRYVVKTDDRPWCNLATWLNQDRWEDEPAEVRPQARGSPAAVPSQADVFKFIGRKAADERQEREDSTGPRAAIPHLSAVGSR